MAAEGSEAEIALSVLAEAFAGSAGNLGIFKQIVEEFPRAHIIGAAHPDIGGIFSACKPYILGAQTIGYYTGVLLIIADIFGNLALPLGGKDGCGALLNYI